MMTDLIKALSAQLETEAAKGLASWHLSCRMSGPGKMTEPDWTASLMNEAWHIQKVSHDPEEAVRSCIEEWKRVS